MALTQRDGPLGVKAQAGVTVTTYDGQITALINGVTNQVIHYLQRDIQLKTYTEYHSGNNSAYLQLRQYPVRSVTRVSFDPGGFAGQAPGAFPSSGDLIQGVDFYLMPGQHGIGSSGVLRRINAFDGWYGRASRKSHLVGNQPPLESGNILVVYEAGFDPIPPAIQMSVNTLIWRQVLSAQRGGQIAQSNSYEDASEAYLSPEDLMKLIGTIEQTLGSYRSIVI